MIMQEKNKSYEKTNPEFVSIPRKLHPFKNPHRLPTEPMGIHHSPDTHTIPIPMGIPWESPYPRQPCCLGHLKIVWLIDWLCAGEWLELHRAPDVPFVSFCCFPVFNSATAFISREFINWICCTSLCSCETAPISWEFTNWTLFNWALIICMSVCNCSVRSQLLTSFSCWMTSYVDCDDVSSITVTTNRHSCRSITVI